MTSKDIHEIIKVGVILFLITAISAGILAAVNAATAPIIEENSINKRKEAMNKVLPEANENFTEYEYVPSGESSVTAVYTADDAGVVVLCEPNGYGGAISLVVGIKADGTVNGVDITSQSETPGLGANCVKEDFRAKFTGKTAGITVVKNGAKENQVDAMSSATITTKAVTKGVNDALNAAAEVMGG